MNKMLLTNRASTWESFFLITLALFSASCLSVPNFRSWERERDERELVERAVAEFHTLLNQEKYEDIYNLLEDEKRKPEYRDRFVAAMREVHEEWGEARDTKLKRASFPSRTSSVIMFYNTKFDKGDGQEMFIWQVNGKVVQLSDWSLSRTAIEK